MLPVDAVEVEGAGVGGREVEPQADLGGVVPAGPPPLGPAGLWRARTSVVGGAGRGPVVAGALLDGEAAAGAAPPRRRAGWLKVAEDEAVGAVRADPAALDAGLVRRRLAEAAVEAVYPAPPRNRPEITALLEAVLVAVIVTTPPDGTLTGKWSQAPALKLVVTGTVRVPCRRRR